MLQRILNRFLVWSVQQRRVVPEFPTIRELTARRAKPDDRVGTIVAFFTTNSLYEAEARRLHRSAQILNLPINLYPVESSGSWVRNAGKKPSILMKARGELSGPILYLDVDAVLHDNPWPRLGDFDNADIAAYVAPDGELLSGTVLINDTLGARSVLSAWRDACKEAPDVWDQVVLRDVMRESKVAVTFLPLPCEYCWIFDKVDNVATGPVIVEHLQASRESKKPSDGRSISKHLKRRRNRVSRIDSILFGTEK